MLLNIVKNNKEKIKEGQKIYYEEKGRELKKIYDKENLERTRERDKKRYYSDPEYRTKKILRTRLTKVLKGEKMYSKILEYVGTNWDFLRKWFEYQFDENMSWKNQGKYWDIDHVIPCNAFDLKLESEKFKCFHWRNLRPYHKKDNGDKWKYIIPSIIKEHKKKVVEYEYFYLFGTK